MEGRNSGHQVFKDIIMALTNATTIKIESTLSGTEELAGQTAKITQEIRNVLALSDSAYSQDGTISSGSNDIDLLGSLTDPLNNAVTFDKVMLVYIRNKGDNAMTLGGTNNIPMFANVSDKINIAAGAYFSYIDPTGIQTTAGTGDLITISGTNDDTYDLVVIGSAP